MKREHYFVSDVHLSEESIQRGDYISNFLDWRIYKIKANGERVKQPTVVTVDAKLLRDSYPPDEVIDAMYEYLSSRYDSHEIRQVRSRGYLTYPSWYSPLFMNERPKELPQLRLKELETIASRLKNQKTDYRD